MGKRGFLLIPAALTVGLVLALSACNDVGQCPAKEAVTSGGACSGDMLECAYDLATPSPACDGTNTTIATSCVCTKGVWQCPSPVSCESGATVSGGDEGGASSGDATIGE